MLNKDGRQAISDERRKFQRIGRFSLDFSIRLFHPNERECRKRGTKT
jgi:hypothetical protein